MAVRDTWRRALEYFGLVEGDYIEGDYTDEHAITGEGTAGDHAPREALREPEPAGMTRGRSRRSSRGGSDADDLFTDDPPPRRQRASSRGGGGGRGGDERFERDAGNGGSRGGGDMAMHLVTPRSFNDAQSVADEFKRRKPVILNLQTTDRELSKRLIDFCSGMTYALGGGMQRVADRIFLLTPENVEVSAEEKARLLEGGFFNQS